MLVNVGPSADYYRRFAELEARGVSALYEDWASGVAVDEQVQGLIESLPRQKWQANLVFASARWNGAPLEAYRDFRQWLVVHWDAVAATAMSRSTQTNEAGRCSPLLLQLGRIEGPISLLEVGASAGLCLYPDRYSYRYRTQRGIVSMDPDVGPSEVVLRCDVLGSIDLPAQLPEVVWRAGIDLSPIDVDDPDSLKWLETLVWPEHDERRLRLKAAARIVAADPPLLIAGDLNEEVRGLAAVAPRDTTLVIFHSAVLAYLSADERAHFVTEVQRIDAIWLSNEGSAVLPETRSRLPVGVDPRGDFILARDGYPVALAGGHGQFYRSLRKPQALGGSGRQNFAHQFGWVASSQTLSSVDRSSNTFLRRNSGGTSAKSGARSYLPS